MAASKGGEVDRQGQGRILRISAQTFLALAFALRPKKNIPHPIYAFTFANAFSSYKGSPPALFISYLYIFFLIIYAIRIYTHVYICIFVCVISPAIYILISFCNFIPNVSRESAKRRKFDRGNDRRREKNNEIKLIALGADAH